MSTISLRKGDRISLEKPGGLSKVRMGLGWDPARSKGFLGFGGGGAEIDLDASCIMFAGIRPIDTVWFRQLNSANGSVVHTGDNRTGAGDGDDESILVDLSRLPASVDGLAFTVNSFTGQTFRQVANCHCRLVDETSGGKELCRFELAEQGDHRGLLMAVMKRGVEGWSFTAVGEPGTGRTFEAMVPLATRHL